MSEDVFITSLEHWSGGFLKSVQAKRHGEGPCDLAPRRSMIMLSKHSRMCQAAPRRLFPVSFDVAQSAVHPCQVSEANWIAVSFSKG